MPFVRGCRYLCAAVSQDSSLLSKPPHLGPSAMRSAATRRKGAAGLVTYSTGFDAACPTFNLALRQLPFFFCAERQMSTISAG